MGYCTNCGHALDIGRFCTNCGHPVAPSVDDTGTAERPAVPAAPVVVPPATPPPPPAGQVPPPAPRFPLYADEVHPSVPAGPPPSAPPTGPAAAAPAPPPHRRRLWWPWLVLTAVLVAVILLVAVIVGAGLLSQDDDGSTGSAVPADHPGHGGSGSPTTGSLASQSTVDVPATAPPNQDTSGHRTTYAGANMLDGVPETCWRMPGDGTGEEITVTLPQRTHLRSVGLINGYAKTATDGGRELDWYHGNRRVLAVEWVFDDGTIVPQQLSDTTAVQSVDVDVTTTVVVLRLVEVSPPGKGPASRDYTAISDLSFVARN